MDGSLWQACLEATSAAEWSRRGEETAVSVRQCAGHLHSRSNLAPARAAAQRDRGRGNQRHPFQGVLAAPLLRCFLASAVLPVDPSICGGLAGRGFQCCCSLPRPSPIWPAQLRSRFR